MANLVKLSLALSAFIVCCMAKSCEWIVPGARKLTVGVDVTQLDLFPLKGFSIGGMKSPVFTLTCKNNTKTLYKTNLYDLPDQVWSLEEMEAGVKSGSVKVIRSYKQVKTQMSASVGISGGYGGFSFSMSTSYKKMQNTITQKKKQIIDTSISESSHKIQLRPPTNAGVIDPTFAADIARLKGIRYRSNKDTFDRIISTYGTHYMKNGEFGGKVRQYIEISSSYAYSKTDKQLSVQAELSYDALFFSVGASASFSTGKSQVDSNFESSKEVKIMYYGGEANLGDEKGLQYWQPTVDKAPVLFKVTLVPLYTMIYDRSIRYHYKSAIQQYVMQKFLVELGRKLSVASTVQQNTILITFQNELAKHALSEFLNVYELQALNDEIEYQLETPQWFSQYTNLCFKYSAARTGHKQCNYRMDATNPETFCALPNQYTQTYHDNTGSGSLGCYMAWQIKSFSYADWFSEIQICLNHMEYDARWGAVYNERCATVNRFTSQFYDNTYKDGSTYANRKWMIKLPEHRDVPLWFKETKICLHVKPNKKSDNKQCSGSERKLCAKPGEWTAVYTDKTHQGIDGGCLLQWGWETSF